MRLKIERIVNRFGNVRFKLIKTSEKLNKKKYENKHIDTYTFLPDSCFNIGNKIKLIR